MSNSSHQSPPARWAFVAAIIVPLLLIGGIVLILGLQKHSVKPAYDFLYLVSDEYYHPTSGLGVYRVVNQRLEYQPAPQPSITPLGLPPVNQTTKPDIYRYQVNEDRSIKLTEAEAQQLKLSDQPYSPDDYTVSEGSDGDDYGLLPSLFFGGSDYYGVYIKNKSAQRKIEVVGGRSYRNFQFLGWVLE